MKKNLLQYDVTKILKTGKHWLQRCNGKTETMEYIRQELDNQAVISLVVTIHQQKPFFDRSGKK